MKPKLTNPDITTAESLPHDPVITSHPTKDWRERFDEKFTFKEYGIKDLTTGNYDSDFSGIKSFISKVEEESYKRGRESLREEILEGIERSLTHYYRSKFSQDCSRNETEEEKSTEMLTKDDILSIINPKSKEE